MSFQLSLLCQVSREAVLLQVIAQLSSKYPVPAIRQAVEWLAQEGHLYTTSDDHVYKSTNL